MREQLDLVITTLYIAGSLCFLFGSFLRLLTALMHK